MDPHQRPPDSIKDVYKKYQKMKSKGLDQDPDIVDLPTSLHTSAKDKVRIVEEWSGNDLTAAFRAFSGQDEQTYAELPARIPVYEHADMPGRTQFRYACYKKFLCTVLNAFWVKRWMVAIALVTPSSSHCILQPPINLPLILSHLYAHLLEVPCPIPSFPGPDGK